MALNTAADYVRDAQILLNDVSGVRYTNGMILNALTDGMYDMQRLRPDLFIGVAFPDVLLPDFQLNTIIEPGYRVALLEYAVGWCERVDQETSDTARATMYYGSFAAKLTGSTI